MTTIFSTNRTGGVALLDPTRLDAASTVVNPLRAGLNTERNPPAV